MQIFSVEIENFGLIKKATLALDNKGLVLIQGENLDDTSADSNGSGKSTLAEAISWCLFGTTARGVSGDDVINNVEGKNCYVGVVMGDGDTAGHCERWRKKTYKGKKDGVAFSVSDASGEAVDLTKGKPELTQAEIVRFLGCTEEVFNAAVYCGQEQLPNLPAMTDKQIKELVEQAAGIDILTDTYKLALANLRNAEAEEGRLAREYERAEESVNQATGRRDDYLRRRDEEDAQNKTRIELVEADLKGIAKGAREVAAEAGKIDVVTLSADRDFFRVQVEDVEKEREKERELQQAVSAAERDAASARARLDAELTQLKRAKTHLDAIDGKTGTPCGECGKSFAAEDLEAARKLSKTKVDDLTKSGLLLKAAFETATAAIEPAKKALADYRAKMTDVSETVAKIREIDAQIAEHGRLTTRLETLKKDAVKAKARIDELKAATNPFIDMIAKAESEIEAAQANVTKLAAGQVEAGQTTRIALTATKVFGPSGVRAYILDTVTPFLNDRTSHYLGTLSDGRIEAVWTTLTPDSKGELKEKFSIAVEKKGGGSSFKALSGGEKRKVRLACAFALQDLVASRATKPIELLVLDEVDDALDASGLERLMTLLEQKGREKGTVLVISHNELSDWCRQTVTVKNTGGVSTVEGVLCL